MGLYPGSAGGSKSGATPFRMERAPEEFTSANDKNHFHTAALCRSTGVGRSRLVCSLGDIPSVLLFHICLRAADQEGEPERPPDLAEAIMACHSPCDKLRIFRGRLSVILHPAPISEATGKESQNSSSAIVGPDGDASMRFWRDACKAKDAEGHTRLQDFLDAIAVFPARMFRLFLDTSSKVRSLCPTKSECID